MGLSNEYDSSCDGIPDGNSDSNDVSSGTLNSKSCCPCCCIHHILGSRFPVEKGVRRCFERDQVTSYAYAHQVDRKQLKFFGD